MQLASGAFRLKGSKSGCASFTKQTAKLQRFVRDNLRIFNGRRNQPRSFRNLDRLLSEQAYVLAYWQNVNEGINYRRFFTITDLVGMRVEDPVVFEATHAVILQLIGEKVVTGLRIDHIDGLRDPLGYFGDCKNVPAAPRTREANSFYVIVEKILSGDEKLSREWPVKERRAMNI